MIADRYERIGAEGPPTVGIELNYALHGHRTPPRDEHSVQANDHIDVHSPDWSANE